MSKRLTKVLSLILTLVMFLSVSTPAFAWGGGELGDGWDREIGEDDLRPFDDYDPELDEIEDYDYFQALSEDGRIQVTVEAPMGSLPSLAEIHIEPVDAEDIREAVEEVVEGEPDILLAMDISFWLDDYEIEPEEPVKVKITAEELLDKKNLTVVHIPDNEEPEAVRLVPSSEVGFEVGVNEVAFEAKSFSVYAVIGNDDPIPEARVTVNFYNPVAADPSVPVATVYVKNSDVLLGDGERQDNVSYIEDIVYDPGIGGSLPNTQLFRGWSLDVDGLTNAPEGTYAGSEFNNQTTPMTVAQVRQFLAELSIVEGDVLNVYAMVFNVFNVTYEDPNSITVASEYVLCSINDTSADYTITQTYSATDDHHNFEGWKVKTGSSFISDASYNGGALPVTDQGVTLYPQKTTMKVSGNIVFSTEISVGNWLIFNENGKNATYNAPVFVKTDKVLRMCVPIFLSRTT